MGLPKDITQQGVGGGGGLKAEDVIESYKEKEELKEKGLREDAGIGYGNTEL
jgi:hypothetical protein